MRLKFMRFSQFFQVTMCSLLFCAGNLIAQGQSGELLHKTAPEFVRSDLSGRSIDLKAYRGKVVLLNFWATWCASCQVELPRFAAWQRDYGSEGLQIIAVSMDDDATPVRAQARRLQLNFPVLMGDAMLGTQYGGVLGLPVTFLIDRNGVIVRKIKGATDLTKMKSQVKELLLN